MGLGRSGVAPAGRLIVRPLEVVRSGDCHSLLSRPKAQELEAPPPATRLCPLSPGTIANSRGTGGPCRAVGALLGVFSSRVVVGGAGVLCDAAPTRKEASMDAGDELVVQTPDGRVLGVRLWGDPAGAPVFWMHGTPGSRMLRDPSDCYARHGLAVP